VLQSWRDHGKRRVGDLLRHLGRYYEPYRRPFDVDELVEAVGLAECAGRKIMTLSGGQRRRLDVAIGIVGRPEVLFLDEPTAGFDPQARRDFHDLVHRLADRDETTILLTTHDLDEAEKLADGSAAALARQVAGQAEVRWRRHGEAFVHAADDGTEFVRKLLTQYGDEIGDLEVRRASLEDTYMTMVRRLESGDARDALTVFEGAGR
jgi:ABC-2 type transport system ATP-binding protein